MNIDVTSADFRPNLNSIYVRDHTSSSNAWKEVWGNEARKVNPLHDVNVSRNNLIQDAMKTGDWSKYEAFQAKQHPAWYDQVNGVPTKNKVYWGTIIDSRVNKLKEVQMQGKTEAIPHWQGLVEEAVMEFKNAPGATPHVIAFANNSKLAQMYDIEKPDSSWYDSKYNDPLVKSQGKFDINMWYDNPIFEEDPKLKAHVEELVEGVFPTSADEEKNFAATVNEENKLDGSQEAIVAATAVPVETSEAAEEDVRKAFMDLFNEAVIEVASNLVMDSLDHLFNKDSNSENEPQNRMEMQSALQDILTRDQKPSIQSVMAKYELG